jgi:hypothetical protein
MLVSRRFPIYGSSLLTHGEDRPTASVLHAVSAEALQSIVDSNAVCIHRGASESRGRFVA